MHFLWKTPFLAPPSHVHVLVMNVGIMPTSLYYTMRSTIKNKACMLFRNDSGGEGLMCFVNPPTREYSPPGTVFFFYVGSCDENGKLRLVDGGRPYQGRVEICIEGVWGTICDDLFSAIEAQVVCRQLGFGTDGARQHTSPFTFFGEGAGPILLDDLACDGSENTLISCPHPPVGQHNCRHTEDVGVQCPAPQLEGKTNC